MQMVTVFGNQGANLYLLTKGSDFPYLQPQTASEKKGVTFRISNFKVFSPTLAYKPKS
jgi:hypothetical protein